MGDKRLVLILREEGKDDVVLFDRDGHATTIDIKHDWSRLRENRAMAAIMAGASSYEVRDLPGEQIADVLEGSAVTITFRGPLYIGKFRDALPGE